MKRMRLLIVVAAALVMLWTPAGHGADDQPAAGQNVKKLKEMVVVGQSEQEGIKQTPTQTVIKLDEFETIGPKTSVVDVLKTQAIIDYRGETDLDPGVDSIYLRGFDTTRFVAAIDSLTIQKTGGRKSHNIVDYALLPTFMIDRIEILPGPHSALYDSKSIGGVLNMVTKAPVRHDSLKPDFRLNASYGSYNTRNMDATLSGAAGVFTYDMAYRRYATDGYLRHSQTNINTVYSRLGFLLPGDGFVAFSASHTDTGRDATVNNSSANADYNSSYPETDPDASAFNAWQKPTWDGRSQSYRLAYEQTLPIGRLKAGAYYNEDIRNRSYYNKPGDTERANMDTTWWEEGAKIQDEIQWAPNHSTILGFDVARLYDTGYLDSKYERINKRGAFVQHKWGIVPAVDLTLGLRYEAVKVWVTNPENAIPNRDDLIDRNWDQAMPKSFLTWKMDHIAPGFRDTSLSLGVSKIWRAPDFHGDYNPQGRPAGAWLDPEHGIAYDLVFNRRLWKDINFKINYSFYIIEDYIAFNGTYAKYTSAKAGNLRYSDYKLNLDKVHRHGIDLALNGRLAKPLSFYLTYSWQKFYNKGDEPAGKTSLHQRAEHRVTAGLGYDIFENTTVMLDYYYQSEEISEVSEEISEDVWFFRQVKNDPYHLFDLGVKYKLPVSPAYLKDASVSFYIKNLFNEKYYNASGYRGTDRTLGASISVGF